MLNRRSHGQILVFRDPAQNAGETMQRRAGINDLSNTGRKIRRSVTIVGGKKKPQKKTHRPKNLHHRTTNKKPQKNPPHTQTTQKTGPHAIMFEKGGKKRGTSSAFSRKKKTSRRFKQVPRGARNFVWKGEC